MSSHSTTLEERFWAKVDKTPTYWNWTGASSRDYGRRCDNGQTSTTLKRTWSPSYCRPVPCNPATDCTSTKNVALPSLAGSR